LVQFMLLPKPKTPKPLFFVQDILGEIICLLTYYLIYNRSNE